MAPKTAKSPRKTNIPVYKVRHIMKSKDEVAQVGNDAAVMMTIAAEMFIKFLAEQALNQSVTSEVDYKDLAKVVYGDKKYCFLKNVIPQKITVAQYRQLLKEHEKSINERDLAFYFKGGLL